MVSINDKKWEEAKDKLNKLKNDYYKEDSKEIFINENIEDDEENSL